MIFQNYNRAVDYANARALECGWYFSILERINVHLRDYEYRVIPHYWPEAIYIASPEGRQVK